MNIPNSIGKYLIGVVVGIALVAGSGWDSRADAVTPHEISAQLFCTGYVHIMSGSLIDDSPVTCLSSSNSNPQLFKDFFEISQQGWIMDQTTIVQPSKGRYEVGTYLFHK
jgi:hypothetical protein